MAQQRSEPAVKIRLRRIASLNPVATNPSVEYYKRPSPEEAKNLFNLGRADGTAWGRRSREIVEQAVAETGSLV
jgi:hypothetical protein